MITASINLTPDGFCNHDDVVADGEFTLFGTQLVEAADRLLLGRETYDLFAGYWPARARAADDGSGEQRLGVAIDTTPRTVVSTSLTQPQWPGTSVLDQIDADTIRVMGAQEDVLVLGSPSILSQLAALDLVDRYVLLIHPLLGGRGVRLFDGAPLEAARALEQVGARRFASGVQVLEYERAVA